MRGIAERLNARLHAYLPEQQLFLKSDEAARYIRLRPVTQAVGITGVVLVFAWTVIATSILLMDSIGSGNLRDQVAREQATYERRLNEMAAARDARASEAEAAHARFGAAMERVSDMQSVLLASEERLMELEKGVATLQKTLQRTVAERDSARNALAELTGEAIAENGHARSDADRARDSEVALDFLMQALELTSQERDSSALSAEQASNMAQHLAMQNRLMRETNDRIFTQLEEAIELAVTPLERVFRSAGVSPDQLRRAVRSGGQDQSAALRPIAISTQGTLAPDSIEMRANSIIDGLQQINTYRIGAMRMPLSSPVSAGNVRQTSGFGMRRHPLTGRNTMHSGLDWAGPRNTPIHSTADGVVKTAERQRGYGNLVVIEHDFGIETYYAHLNSIAVRPGQRVSRGERIGGMGTTGQSTGVHLHYEIRVGGNPVNPMTYLRAGQNVF